MNFGGIGVVIGHELTHGFDDQGSKFDAQRKSYQLVDRRLTETSSTSARTCIADEYELVRGGGGCPSQRTTDAGRKHR